MRNEFWAVIAANVVRFAFLPNDFLHEPNQTRCRLECSTFCATATRSLSSMTLSTRNLRLLCKTSVTKTYLDFPHEHWRNIRTNNILERLNREIRRRIRVMGRFPDGESTLMLVCAKLRYIASKEWGRARGS